jgi:nitrogen-specific signal transduction histidine kinase
LANAVILLNANNEIENMNRAAMILFSVSQTPGAFYYGKKGTNNLLEWIAEDLERFAQCLMSELALEKSLPDSDPTRHFEIRLQRMLGVSGKFMGTVVMMREITERLRRVCCSWKPFWTLFLTRSFSKTSTEEREPLRAQLFQSQKMEAIGTLSGGIAHDFNNMLTIILGYSELILSEKGETDPSYTGVQKIIHTGRQGTELVQRLLAFSRKAETNPVPLDLNRQILNLKPFRQYATETCRYCEM